MRACCSAGQVSQAAALIFTGSGGRVRRQSSGRARVEFVVFSMLGLTATILGTYGMVQGHFIDFGRTDEFPLREGDISGDDRFGRPL